MKAVEGWCLPRGKGRALRVAGEGFAGRGKLRGVEAAHAHWWVERVERNAEVGCGGRLESSSWYLAGVSFSPRWG